MNKRQAVALVSAHGWLSRQPQNFQADLLRRTQLRQIKPGEFLQRAGELPEGIFGLVEGHVEISVPSGRLTMIKRTGWWFGEAAAFVPMASLLSIQAVKQSHVLALSIADFEGMIADAAYCRSFARLAVEHLEEGVAVIGHLSEHQPRARAAGRLLNLVQYQGGSEERTVNISQDELAEMCAVSRQTINKILKEFITEGLISVQYRAITILDADALLAVSTNVHEGK